MLTMSGNDAYQVPEYITAVAALRDECKINELFPEVIEACTPVMLR